MLNQRRALILGHLIRDYIENPNPIGSSALVQKHKLKISPATVRNDFAVLESHGLIATPHTSSGRVPTVKGYQYFVRYLLKEQAVAKKEIQQLRAQKREHNRKKMVQELASIVGESTALVESDGKYYISGLSHLFAKPEFADEITRASIGDLFDHFEAIANELYSRMGNEVTTLVGENLVSPTCSVMAVKVEPVHDEPFMIMLCGPTRMNYETNQSLLNHIRRLYG